MGALWQRWRRGAEPGRSTYAEAAVARARRAAAEWKRRCEEAAARVKDLKLRVTALEDENRRLRDAEASVRADRDRARALHAQVTTRVKTLHRHLAHAHDAFARIHRAAPSRAVLRGSLGLRYPVALARARGPEAVAREARFHETAPAYAAARDQPLDGTPGVTRTTLQGLTWWVPVLRPQDGVPGSAWLQKQRFPYRAIAQTRELAMGGIMLDIGANLGRMCISRVVLGDVVAAYCAEPDPLNYACLVRNAVDNRLSGLILPDHCAIGDHDGVAALKRERYSGGHHIVAGGSENVIEVPMFTLDTWVRRLGIDVGQVTFIKMDVQGFEGHVLAGAAETLRHRHIAWQMEMSPAHLAAVGTARDALYGRLAAHFSYFTDLNRQASGPRRRPIAELAEALAYVDDQTDLLLFNEAEVVC